MKVDSKEYKGLTIEIHNDECDISPREFDNLGTMVCWHRDYYLGDEQPNCSPDEFLRELAEDIPGVIDRLDYWENEGYGRKDSEGMVEKIIEGVLERNYVILSLYLYDHSGISMNTSGFNCPWDSGQVGYIYISKDKIRKEYNVKKVSKKLLARVEHYLESEVRTYDDFLRGNVYGYVVLDNSGEQLDSCWGFYGDYDKEGGAIENAKSYIDYYRKRVNPILPFEEEQ